MGQGKTKTFLSFFSKKVISYIIVFLLFAFLVPNIVPAGAVDFGNTYAEGIGLGGTDPRIMIARIVQIVLGFLGILAVGLIMYGGFLWMTSEGSEDQISKAKKTIINATIGLIIILSSFAIATFVLSKLMGATGVPGGGPGTGGAGSIGTGTLGNCSVENVYPEDGQRDVPRNTSIMITFKEEVDPTTVCVGGGDCAGDLIIADSRISLYKTDDDPSNYLVNVAVYNTTDRKTFVFVPVDYLGSPSENVWYTMNIDNSVEFANGESVFQNCRNSTSIEWRFEVSNKLDLTPPKILNNGVFPPPDNDRDVINVTSVANRAVGSITVSGTPNVNTPASLLSSTGPNINTVVVDPNANIGGTLVATVSGVDGITTELTRAGLPITSRPFVSRAVDFDGLFRLSLTADQSAGNSWNINISPRVRPDTVTVGRDVYIFVSSVSAPNHIEVGATPADTAANIATVINSRSDINASASGNIVSIEARVAGESGNSIILDSDNGGALSVVPLSGGTDQRENVLINGAKDQPMNSAIQITFNEAIMPVMVAGDAAAVSGVIRVVNADSGALATGVACVADADCISFNCDVGGTDTCQGTNDYLPGTFRVSNMYKTIEFLSDNQCGVNGCGEPIYCLPENAHVRVEMQAASLPSCASDADCVSKTPFDSCMAGICSQDFVSNLPEDERIRHYPGANVLAMDGVMDTALNSMDGDRNSHTAGPAEYYSDNPVVYSSNAVCDSDFNTIIDYIKKARIANNATLADLTGSNCTNCECGASHTPAECQVAVDKAMSSIGLASMKDYGGSYYRFDENEDEPGHGMCRGDILVSDNCSSVTIPFYYCDEGDNFMWSFFINDTMEVDPPEVISVNPSGGAITDIVSPIEIEFSELVMSGTLKTGTTLVVDTLGNEFIHKNVNLWSVTGVAPGYWIKSENLDNDLDGQIDTTKAYIEHSMFAESAAYRAQIGSGLKDIYQNCFKPSTGPGCTASETNPSCCGAVPASTLDANGNCI